MGVSHCAWLPHLGFFWGTRWMLDFSTSPSTLYLLFWLQPCLWAKVTPLWEFCLEVVMEPSVPCVLSTCSTTESHSNHLWWVFERLQAYRNSAMNSWSPYFCIPQLYIFPLIPISCINE
jgi:hypothetical protein